jgi:hypothetical protein
MKLAEAFNIGRHTIQFSKSVDSYTTKKRRKSSGESAKQQGIQIPVPIGDSPVSQAPRRQESQFGMLFMNVNLLRVEPV